MEEFINLHNRTVSRSEVEGVVSLAKEQNNTEVIYRLSRILNAYPTEQRFVINIKDYPATPTALAGAHHTGDYREALDENGRLRKGYKFVKGKIIPPQPSHLSAPSHLSDDELTFLAAAGIDYFEEAPDDEAQGLGKPIPAADIYQMITDKVISMFKNAKASDYHRAWKDDAFFIPLNFDSKKPYRGVNRLLLQERIGFAGAFRNPYFLTFNQIKKHGGRLKKGTRGYEVVYYSIRYIVPADKNTGRKAYSSTNAHKVIDFIDKHKLSEDIVTRIPMIRYYNVYNGASIEGIDFQLDKLQIGRAVPDTAPENQAAALIVENYPNPPAIKHEGNQAYYSPSGDYVKMPKKEQFDSINDYYRTLFHELTHSTGHDKRLDRGIHLMLEKEDYAKEELVAEFGAVFLSAWAGIMWYTNKNHAVYLKNWNSAIKEAENDNKFLMKAASLAQQATDYILNLNAAGQPAFLSKYEKNNKKAEKPKKKAPASKIQIIPPYPIDIESNEENDDYMQLEKELSDLMGDKFEVWANNLIEQKRKDRLAERSKEIKANIDTLKNKEKGATAYEYVRNEYGYNYKVDKKDTKKYEVTLTIYRYGSFNPNENYYDTFKTPEECSAFIIKTIDEQDGFYYSNWYGLSELQNKINELKGYQYSKQFNYQEEEKKAENPKPQAPKAPEKFPAAGTTKVFFTSQVDEIVDYVKKNGDNRGYINIDFTDKQTLKLLSQYGWGTYGFINTYDYPESTPKSKTKGVMSLKKIVSTDKLRIQITGVYIDSDYYIATNAISLIWVPRPKNDEYKTGWIFDANFKCKKLGGCKIEDYLINSDRFPIDRIREMQKAPIAYTSQQIDLTTLLNHLYRGYKAIRAINSTQEAIVITLQADKKIQYIDLKILIDLLDALRNNGAQTITFGFENLSGNSPIHISTDTQLQGLVMPRIFDENKVPTVKNCLMIAPLPLTLTEISKPTKGLSAPTDGTLFGKYPEISTDTFKDMKVSELRAFTLSYYLTHLKGKKVAIKNHLKEVIFTTKAGRKIAKGEAMYKEKAAVVERLEELIKNSTYNNWGSRKTQDNPNILGYLNFKSKLTIDGEKRHVRIAISLTRERKTELKNVEVGNKKSASFRKATVVNPQDGRNETLSTNIPAKTVPNIEKSTTPPRRGRAKSFCGDSAPTNIPAKTVPNKLANRQIDKLAVPTVYVEHLPEETNLQISTAANQNTLDAKMAALQTRNWETFVIANPQLQRFLGDVERKSAESTVITIAGGAGSGKTRFAFQFINALAQNYTVGHASLEEHPDSKLYYDKVQQYIDETALPNIEAPEIKDLDQLEALIQRNEVIVIDSFAKLQELNPRFLLDRDLRKKYDGKLFLLIYQLTGEGKMRGGSKSEYDGDIILLTHVAPDYRENYIYPSKNRYNALPATQLRYSTYYQQMLDIPKELGTGRQPTEAISLPPAPQTNVYEVIY